MKNVLGVAAFVALFVLVAVALYRSGPAPPAPPKAIAERVADDPAGGSGIYTLRAGRGLVVFTDRAMVFVPPPPLPAVAPVAPVRSGS